VTIGNSGDLPAAGDFNGDGTDSIALFRPSTGTWYITNNDHTVVSHFVYGQNGDRPIIGDWAGTGHSQVGVYRPSTGQLFIAGHQDPINVGPGLIPVNAPYPYRAPGGLSASGVSGNSIRALDFGGTALSLSTGSTATSHGPASGASSSTGAPSSTEGGRPKQASTPSRTHLHDLAIASLKGIRKRTRGSRLHGV